MGSVSSANPGVANLLQLLSNVNSPVASSPAAVSALEKAPASDIARLSVEALQLQSIDELFGISNGFGPETSGLANLSSLLTGTSAGQLASYQGAQQLAETQALFGGGQTSSPSNSLLNVLG